MFVWLIGKVCVIEMMLFGECVYGFKVIEWGLIYKSVFDDMLMIEVMVLVQ